MSEHTIKDFLAWGVGHLAARGVETPRLDGELLLAHALGVERVALLLEPGRVLDAATLARARELVRRRGEREPVAHILGHKEFWSLDLHVPPGVLIPRPDTETLVAAALTRLTPREAPWRLLEIGVGSGAILLSLLAELPQAWGVGIDISPLALECTRENAARHGLTARIEPRLGSLFAPVALGEKFHVVLSNPPYVGLREWSGLQPEVTRWEPEVALLAGEDGLDLLRQLPGLARDHLEPGGWLLLEMGSGQGEAVRGFLREAGYRELAILPDLAGRPRVACGCWLG